MKIPSEIYCEYPALEVGEFSFEVSTDEPRLLILKPTCSCTVVETDYNVEDSTTIEFKLKAYLKGERTRSLNYEVHNTKEIPTLESTGTIVLIIKTV